MVDHVQRKYVRFETDAKISFKIPYDFRAEVDFHVQDGQSDQHYQSHHANHHRTDSAYIGFSKNISVGGLCFESPKELKNGDKLWIELHLPKSSEVIYIEGEVRWSRLIAAAPGMVNQYLTGVLVRRVDGAEVQDTIYFDDLYKVEWSQLLERVLGGFAKLHRNSKPA